MFGLRLIGNQLVLDQCADVHRAKKTDKILNRLEKDCNTDGTTITIIHNNTITCWQCPQLCTGAS